MLKSGKLIAGLAVFGVGYVFGNFQGAETVRLQAVQEQSGVENISNETLQAYQKFRKGCYDLSDSLKGESLNVSAVEGVNFFALSVGGVDAVRDLEEGRGVDPETFAAIYADRANPEVTKNITTDSDGRKRYKDTIVRMYSKERLKEVFQRRDQIEIRGKRVSG